MKRKGWTLHWSGHIRIKDRSHPRSDPHGFVFEHILIVEKALGKPLAPGVVVHHHGNTLVICQNQAYHMLLHQRIRALRACGHANWRKCIFCKHYDAPENLYIDPAGHVMHRACNAKNQRERRRKLKCGYKLIL